MKTQYQYFCNSTNTKEKNFFYKHTLQYNTIQSHSLLYLTPDYFLPSSHSESYYSKKYSGSTNFSNHKLFRSRIKQVATVSLIFLSMITGEVFAGDKRPKSKVSSGRKQEVTYESINLSSSLPDVVPQLPLPDLIPSTPPPPPMPPLPDIVPPVILPDVVPVPPAPPMALSQPHLLSDAGSSTSDKKSALFQSIRDFGGKLFKLKKVKQEPKPKVISSDEAEFMSQILARREAIAGEKKSNKFKNAVGQVIVLTAEEQKVQTGKIEASAEKINNKQEIAYQSVEERLNNNLSSSEKENYNNLNNTAQIVDQKGKKIEDQYEDTSDSTVKRTLDEMGKNSRPIL